MRDDVRVSPLLLPGKWSPIESPGIGTLPSCLLSWLTLPQAASAASDAVASVAFAVNLQFPVNWIWWVTMAVSTFALSSLSEISIYYLHDMKEIALEH